MYTDSFKTRELCLNFSYNFLRILFRYNLGLSFREEFNFKTDIFFVSCFSLLPVYEGERDQGRVLQVLVTEMVSDVVRQVLGICLCRVSWGIISE